jgi:DNA mismatch repair protein MLH1
MLENSVDAGATSISVTCKSGGVKLLQVTDNGKGIRKEDLGIVCERHTTSKISSFEDLETVSTYGFRGEALASISMVARVTIITKTQDSDCAYRVEYQDSRPLAKGGGGAGPQACAGVKGTTIMVQDLFYNVPTRLRTLKSSNEEYRQILNVVSKYAVHYGDAGVGFSCKAQGKSVSDVHTNARASSLDNIRAIFGSKVARELLSFATNAKETVEGEVGAGEGSEQYVFSAKGYVSNANWSTKSGNFILFINHRLVEHGPLKRAVNAVYSEYLPRHGKPFVYLSLELPPREVDVNVHPTKKEVIFSRSDEIVGDVCVALRKKLAGGNQSRVFHATPLTHAPMHGLAPPASSSAMVSSVASKDANTPSSKRKGGYTEPAVAGQDQPESRSQFEVSLSAFARKSAAAEPAKKKAKQELQLSVDRSGRTIVSFSSAKPKKKSAPYDPRRLDRTDASNPAGRLEPFFTRDKMTNVKKGSVDPTRAPSNSRITAAPGILAMAERNGAAGKGGGESASGRQRVKYPRPYARPGGEDDPAELTSVQNIREDIKLDCHPGLVAVLRKHVFVGVIDDDYSLLQYQTKMFMFNHSLLADELFYQTAILNFGNFYVLEVPNRPKLKNLLGIGIGLGKQVMVASTQEESSETDERLKKAFDCLMEPMRRSMLKDYFSIDINDDGCLAGLPDLLPGYTPSAEGLPGFVLRLATKVDFSNEQPCFEDIAQCLGWYFSLLPFHDAGNVAAHANEKGTLRWFVQHQLLPTCRSRFSPRREFATDGTMLQVAALENLYKIFERC